MSANCTCSRTNFFLCIILYLVNNIICHCYLYQCDIIETLNSLILCLLIASFLNLICIIPTNYYHMICNSLFIGIIYYFTFLIDMIFVAQLIVIILTIIIFDTSSKMIYNRIIIEMFSMNS